MRVLLDYSGDLCLCYMGSPKPPVNDLPCFVKEAVTSRLSSLC